MSHLQRAFFQNFRSAFEYNSAKSETVPGQSIPMKEILQKAAQGVPVHINRPAFDSAQQILSGSMDETNRIGFNRIDIEERQFDASYRPLPSPKKDPALASSDQPDPNLQE